jgi:hypothetical protein
MIQQIHPVQARTEPLANLNKDLLQARHIQAQIKERGTGRLLPDRGEIWGTMIAVPYLVPITRWSE